MTPITHAAILAGGRSSRMGADKALLSIGGVPMLQRVARAALAACPQLLVVGRPHPPPGWPADLPATFLPDDAPDFSGPIAGLIRALEFANAPLLLLACDTPLLTTAAIAALLAAHAAAPPGTRATLASRQAKIPTPRPTPNPPSPSTPPPSSPTCAACCKPANGHCSR